MILLLDNYDSFTYNLYDYLLQTGVDCRVVRNDEWAISDFEKIHFKALVLSPGPKKPGDAGIMMDLIAHYHLRIPILGVCLGHQAIGEYFGAKLIKARVPMHGKTTFISHQGQGIFEGIPSPFQVMRYHSLLLESLEGTPLKGTAYSPEDELMAFQHHSLPLTGVQFHPESILTEYGLKMIANWSGLVSD